MNDPNADHARLKALATGTYKPPARDPFDIETDDLHGGLSGFPLPIEEFALGEGLTLRRTYAKVMAPFVIAFAPPVNPSTPNPGPWVPVSEKSLLVLVELELKGAAGLGFNRINTMWFVVALLRLKLALPAKMPILADRPIQRIRENTELANIVPVELQLQHLLTAPPEDPSLADFEWLRSHLAGAASLMKDPIFNRAFQTFDSAVHTQSPGAGIVTAWASIETLIRPGHKQITKRVCQALATYLNGPGPGRDRAFTRIGDCYEARGGAAHAGAIPEAEEFRTAFSLARATLLKAIEHGKRPDIEELLARWKILD